MWRRAQKIASEAVKKASYIASAIAVAGPVIVALIGTIGINWGKDEVHKLSERIAVVETRVGKPPLDDRVSRLEEIVAKMTSTSQPK
jgi:hypothetical protein